MALWTLVLQHTFPVVVRISVNENRREQPKLGAKPEETEKVLQVSELTIIFFQEEKE